MSRRRPVPLDTPILHADHRRPMTRRDFLAAGLAKGGMLLAGASVLSLFSNPRAAYAALSSDLEALRTSCGIAVQGAGKIPFICFDLAGGANIAGSNVLVGGRGGPLDFLATDGYNKLGLPGDIIPSRSTVAGAEVLSNIDQSLGLPFHSDSAFGRGIRERVAAETANRINGTVFAARSENDTGNNPHNPMYGIATAGADGSLLGLIGSRNSDSGGNSMAPLLMIDPSKRPTKVDRPSDVTGLVDTGNLVGLLDQSDAVAVMESIARISDRKLGQINSGVSRDEVIKELVRCGYVKSADLADRFGDPSTLNPELDTDIVGPGAIFSSAEFASDDEFRKTASVMKLVVNGFAGAGTITMGGFDYHTGDRATGEQRDLRAGRCIGACLEYAARRGVPLMVYVFSDGSVASNGRIDDSVEGRGKGEWTGDNSSTAASFYLVYNPAGRPVAVRNQVGYMRPDGSVETASSPAAGNVNLLVESVIWNYMALHGDQGRFETLFPSHGLGPSTMRDSLTGLAPIVSGTIG